MSTSRVRVADGRRRGPGRRAYRAASTSPTQVQRKPRLVPDLGRRRAAAGELGVLGLATPGPYRPTVALAKRAKSVSFVGITRGVARLGTPTQAE